MNRKAMEEQIRKLRAETPDIRIAFNKERSAISLMRGRLPGRAGKVPDFKKNPYSIARKVIREYRALFGDIDEKKNLANGRVLIDRQDQTHVSFQQMHGDVIVLGGGISVHYAADGSVYLIRSTLAHGIDAPKKPSVTAEKAAEIALQDAGDGSELFESVRPVLFVAGAAIVHREMEEREYYLCWKMRVIPPRTSRIPDQIYLVDASDGTVLMKYPAVWNIGTGYYSQGTTLNSEPSDGTFRLRDTVTSSGWLVETKPVIHTYDDAGVGALVLTDYSEDSDDNWDNDGVVPENRCNDQREEVDIHRYLGYILSYYYTTHGHNSWDNAGTDIKAHAHNNALWIMPNNAFWDTDRKQIYVGDGNGVWMDFVCPLDVLGHEFTHGVNDGFGIFAINDGEIGAGNEALADIFSYFIAFDYPAECPDPEHLGVRMFFSGYSRNIADPSRDPGGTVLYDATDDDTKIDSVYGAGYYPDHYSIRYTGEYDHHGVHVNCPILTHAFYLMINGGTHRLSRITVSGIGTGPVEQMLYAAISTPGLLTQTSTFADIRIAMIESCLSLYPENLGYLATVKSAFAAAGIGPDLYIRDQLSDQGAEPGTLSCMSPDIIVRQLPADAATLAQIGDSTNSSLCEKIELGGRDHSVYFRVFNRGSVPASGTLRLFISPVSTFPVPGSWHEVGHYDFGPVPENGGIWVPGAADQCITLTSALIDSLGVGHFCFIGIIECDADPAPDYTLINDTGEFHDFIIRSNNFAWRNCVIEDNVHPSLRGEIPPFTRDFRMQGFGRPFEPRNLEIDTRDLPAGTELVVLIPEAKFFGLKASELGSAGITGQPAKVADTLDDPDGTAAKEPIRQIPLGLIAGAAAVSPEVKTTLATWEVGKYQPVKIRKPGVFRLEGFRLDRAERTTIRFVVKFPKKTGDHDVTLAFRERVRGAILGQMNYVFRIRRARA
ncbi:M4 family metallopeptidase [uncultured Methanoregula sp.]|uniref:M4 family metallopeptidase n=1 Tax=uncultured Methanoregula sp. TaxID=1005933 RepID=UPI002AAB95D0|nr:M4 family metallopeptidase [uncultured Methanoregula sp.]